MEGIWSGGGGSLEQRRWHYDELVPLRSVLTPEKGGVWSRCTCGRIAGVVEPGCALPATDASNGGSTVFHSRWHSVTEQMMSQ